MGHHISEIGMQIMSAINGIKISRFFQHKAENFCFRIIIEIMFNGWSKINSILNLEKGRMEICN